MLCCYTVCIAKQVICILNLRYYARKKVWWNQIFLADISFFEFLVHYMYAFTLVRPYHANYYIGLYSHTFFPGISKGRVYKGRLPLPFPIKFRLVSKRMKNELRLICVFNVVYAFFKLVVPHPLPGKQHCWLNPQFNMRTLLVL